MTTFIFFIFWKIYKHKRYLVALYNKVTNKKLRDCKSIFLAVIQQKKWQLACQQLYLFIYANKSTQEIALPLSKESTYICFKDYFSDDIEKTLLVNILLKAAKPTPLTLVYLTVGLKSACDFFNPV